MTAVLVFAAHFTVPQFQSWIFSVGLLIVFAQVLVTTWKSGSAFRVLNDCGVNIPVCVAYPISYRELSRLLLKVSTIQLPAVFGLMTLSVFGFAWINQVQMPLGWHLISRTEIHDSLRRPSSSRLEFLFQFALQRHVVFEVAHVRRPRIRRRSDAFVSLDWPRSDTPFPSRGPDGPVARWPAWSATRTTAFTAGCTIAVVWTSFGRRRDRSLISLAVPAGPNKVPRCSGSAIATSSGIAPTRN